jgi:secreted trypsin-like serine protease
MPAQDERVPDGSRAVLSGWGYIIPGVELPDELQRIDMAIISDTECQERFDADGNYPDIDNDSMICAYIEGGSGCQEDSGGPLTCGSDESLCGVVSWGSGARFTNVQELFLTRILNGILNRLRIYS